MIAGPRGVHICNECVRLCRTIVSNGSEPAPATSLDGMKPAAIRDYLDQHVIGQPNAKVALSVAVYNHFKRLRYANQNAGEKDVELSKGNILMIGPTGSGKTLLARTIARRLGVPFAMVDATSLTEAGYVGEDVESIVKNLWLAANRDPELAGRGIVCIDEIDKVARSGGASPSQVRDVGGEGVQQGLLKIIESQKVLISPDQGRGRPAGDLVTVDTTNILFICCGAFSGLDQIVARRVSRSAIGFGADPRRSRQHKSELLRQVRAEDLQKFGLIPEFVGRLPVIVSLDELEETDLVEILWKPRNALVRQYRRMFELEGVKLRFHHEAMTAVVAEALRRGTGARGLRSILERIMLDVMFDLPTLQGVRECVITADVVERHIPPVFYPEPSEHRSVEA
jgi:ATP-dependent Clp protease ATP-binding subunit ClpX